MNPELGSTLTGLGLLAVAILMAAVSAFGNSRGPR